MSRKIVVRAKAPAAEPAPQEPRRFDRGMWGRRSERAIEAEEQRAQQRAADAPPKPLSKFAESVARERREHEARTTRQRGDMVNPMLVPNSFGRVNASEGMLTITCEDCFCTIAHVRLPSGSAWTSAVNQECHRCRTRQWPPMMRRGE